MAAQSKQVAIERQSKGACGFQSNPSSGNETTAQSQLVMSAPATMPALRCHRKLVGVAQVSPWHGWNSRSRDRNARMAVGLPAHPSEMQLPTAVLYMRSTAVGNCMTAKSSGRARRRRINLIHQVTSACPARESEMIHPRFGCSAQRAAEGVTCVVRAQTVRDTGRQLRGYLLDGSLAQPFTDQHLLRIPSPIYVNSRSPVLDHRIDRPRRFPSTFAQA